MSEEPGEGVEETESENEVAETVIPLPSPEGLPEAIEGGLIEEGIEEEVLTAVSPSIDPEPEPVSPELEVDEVPLFDPTPIMPEPEPTMRTSPPPPAQPPVDWEGNAQRRGCITTLLGATFGAILGAVLTLAVLAALNNGSLNYAASDTEIRTQLDTEIISRTNELNQLSTRVSLVATQEAEANQSLQSDFAEANEAINEELANNEEIISYLATRSGALELRLDEVAGAADTFTDFLDGLRLLLDDLDESPDSATPAPTTRITATPSAEDATSSPTPTPTPLSETTPTPTTTAVPPTRTPQPTATPFTFPTSTPASQP